MPKPLRLHEVLKAPAGEYRVLLTPDDAELLLKRNKNNRPINDTEVLKWSIEMEEGRWQYNGETMKLDEDKNLIDGQTRLTALTLQKPDYLLLVLMVTGLPRETQATMDQGRKRALNDQLTLAGVMSDKSMASAIRLYIVYQNDWLFRDNNEIRARLSAPRIVEWSQDNPDAISLIRDGAKYRRIPGARPALMQALYALFATERGSVAATEFFQQLIEGVGLKQGSPVLALRNRLSRYAVEKIKLRDRELLGLTINAFNAWRENRTMARLQLPNDKFYTAANFPKIK